jgi:hypothetical protein
MVKYRKVAEFALLLIIKKCEVIKEILLKIQ